MVVMFHQFVTIRCQSWLNCIDQAVLWVDPVKFELIRLFLDRSSQICIDSLSCAWWWVEL